MWSFTDFSGTEKSVNLNILTRMSAREHVTECWLYSGKAQKPSIYANCASWILMLKNLQETCLVIVVISPSHCQFWSNNVFMWVEDQFSSCLRTYLNVSVTANIGLCILIDICTYRCTHQAVCFVFDQQYRGMNHIKIFLCGINSCKGGWRWPCVCLSLPSTCTFRCDLNFEPLHSKNTQNYNYACCFVWVSNLVSHILGGIRPRVFENRVLRKIFGPKTDEITRNWRRRLAEDPCDLYSSSNIIRVIKLRRMRWAGHVTRMGERRGKYRIMVGEPEWKWPLGKPRRRWEDTIKKDVQEVGWWAWNVLICLRIYMCDGRSWMRQWTSRFHFVTCWGRIFFLGVSLLVHKLTNIYIKLRTCLLLLWLDSACTL